MAQGVRVGQIFAMAWAIGAVLATIAGVFAAIYPRGSGNLETGTALFALRAFPAVILGGLDSIPGAILGGLIVGIVENVAAGYIDPYVGGGTKDFAHEHNTKAPEGAVAGVAGGGVVGGTIGLLAGIGALAIPGLGPFIAAGPLMAALSGAAAGAALGGVAGALVGMGIPELEAKKYEGKLRGGNVLLAVHVDDSAQQKRAEQVMKTGGAHDVSAVGESSVPKVRTQQTRP